MKFEYLVYSTESCLTVLVMTWNYGLFIVLVVLQVKCLKPEGCDPSLNAWFREGILGQVGMFPWLGVIRVELHEGIHIRIALTGAVLIKHGYALTIADDIARIPRWIFKKHTKALFFPHDGEPWLFRLKEYLTHPEYPTIKNTIALIKLELDGYGLGLIPICWPPFSYNASDQLYVMGLTDANDILEKEVYKVQYVQQYNCIVFYNKAGLNEMDDLARDYQCACAVNRKQSCIWETGMVLASNATGTWVLLGFGIRGPGCGSPARFIEMYQYLRWIDRSTSNLDDGENFNRQPGLRKGGYRKKSKILDVAVHHFFRSGSDDLPKNVHPWFFDWYEHGLGEYGVDRLAKNAILLSVFNETANCSNKDNILIYSEYTNILADDETSGHAVYELSVMDLSIQNYTCVTVTVKAKNETLYDETLHSIYQDPLLKFSMGTYVEPLGNDQTPRELLKKYMLPKRQNDTEDQAAKKVFLRAAQTENMIPESIIQEIDDAIFNLTKILHQGFPPAFEQVNSTHKQLKVVSEDLKKIKETPISPAPDLDSTRIKLDSILKLFKEDHIKGRTNTIKFMIKELTIVSTHLSLMKRIVTTTTTTTTTTTKTTTTKPPDDDGSSTTPGTTTPPKKKFRPHKFMEIHYITDSPERMARKPFFNLRLEFDFYKEAVLELKVWGLAAPPKHVTTKPGAGPTRTRFGNLTTKNPAGRQGNDPESRSGTYLELRRASDDYVDAIPNKDDGEELTNACGLAKFDGMYVMTIVFYAYW